MASYIESPPPDLFFDRNGQMCRTLPSGRVRKVWGGLRPHMPADYPCLCGAGEGTDHLGIGFCKKHDQGFKTREQMGHLLDKAIIQTKDPKLSKALADVRDIDPNDLYGQDFLLRFVHAVMFEYLDKQRDEWTGMDTKHMLMLIEHARRLQDTKLRSDQIKTFNPMAIQAFVKLAFLGIVSVLQKNKLDHKISSQVLDKFEEAIHKSFSDSLITDVSLSSVEAAEDAYLECPGDSLLEDDDGNAVLCAVTGIPIYDTDDYEQKFEFRSAKKIEEAD